MIDALTKSQLMKEIDAILAEIDAPLEEPQPQPTPREPLLLPEHAQSYEESDTPVGFWVYFRDHVAQLGGRFYLGEQTPYELQWLSVQLTNETYYEAVCLLTTPRQVV